MQSLFQSQPQLHPVPDGPSEGSVVVAALVGVLLSIATLGMLMSDVTTNRIMGAGMLFASFVGLIPAAIASNKGRSFGIWWVYGWALWIVALIHALCLQSAPQIIVVSSPVPQPPAYAFASPPPDWGEPTPRQAAQLRAVDAVLREWKRCPMCAEVVRVEARVCFHCRRDIQPQILG